MTAPRSRMHWFVPPSIDIRSETIEQQREARGSICRVHPPPSSSAAAAAAISVFTPVAADSARAFSPRTHERCAATIMKQTSRFAFDAAPAATAVAASPSASQTAAGPVRVVSCSTPFLLLRSPMLVPVTPVAVMQLCAPQASPCWQQQQLSPDQQALRSWLLSPTCCLLRRRPAFAGHCRSASASTAASDLLSEAQLQSMLDACMLADSSAPPSSVSPQPQALILALSHLRYLDSLHLAFHSATEIVDALRELTLQSHHALREIQQLLRAEPTCSAASSAAAAWTILLHSGAGVDSPFFLHLLFSQRTPAVPSLSPSVSAPSSSSELDQLLSLLQSFMKHYAQETREPLVSFLQQQRCAWDPQQSQLLQHQSSVDLRNSAPVQMSDDEPLASAVPSLPQLTLPPCSHLSRFPSPTALVHRLFMSLGPVHVDRLPSVIAELVAADPPSQPRDRAQPQLQLMLGPHMHAHSPSALNASLPSTKLDSAPLSWMQLSAAAAQSCLAFSSPTP